MSQKSFVYTELQVHRPFTEAVWRDVNPQLLQQPGLVNKTWLAGATNQSVGGLYEFDSIANAQHFAIHVFPDRAKAANVAPTTRIFDGAVVEAASRELNSLHFGGVRKQVPGAFVYTEVQISAPFPHVPWSDVNRGLKAQPGLLHKTWLSGFGNHSVGGFYAFDTLENANTFVSEVFPLEAQGLNAAYTTRVFDASLVQSASTPMHSPFFA